MERFPLDDAAIACISELKEQMKANQIAIQAVLMYFARQHNLKGQISLAEGDQELILQEQPQEAGKGEEK